MWEGGGGVIERVDIRVCVYGGGGGNRDGGN